MMQNYCMNCMRQTGDSLICPRCGFNNTPPVACEPYHLTPGTLLAGKYLVGRVIGEGGFGITYIGLQTTLSRRVAIKEFYPAGAANRANSSSEIIIVTHGKEDFYQKGVERFLLEAKNVAAFCEEDGIVDIMDYFQENNTAYIVMEYLEGETLKDYISKHGCFRPERLIELMMPLMHSLAAMHKQGVIHRDISPDNIMYHKNSRLKLMDFGSARFFTNEESQLSVILKQGFAPEEQYRSNGAQGPYTDVYALCATIYTCITGKIPVNSLDRLSGDTLKRPSELGVPISPQHEAALMHGMAVRAQDRTPDIPTLIRELNNTSPVTDNPAAAVAPAVQKTIGNQPVAEAPRANNAGQTAYPQSNHNTYPQQSQTGYPQQSQTGYSQQNQTGYPQQSQTGYPQQGQTGYPQQNANGYQGYTGYPQSNYPNPQPPKKSNLPKILAITIPSVVVVAAIVILVIALNSGSKSSNDNPQSSAGFSSANSYNSQSSTYISGSSFNFDGEASEESSDWFSSSRASSSSKASSKSSSKKDKSYSGLTIAEAKANTKGLVRMFNNNLLDNDEKATAGDTVSSEGLYYIYDEEDNYRRIVYVYHNKTAKYYRAIEASPEYMSVNGSEVEYSITYFSPSDSSTTLDGAVENCFYLSKTYSKYYEITDLYK